MSRPFTPIASSTNDGADLTLCKILEATAAGGSLASGFNIPPYNDVIFTNDVDGNPTEIVFQKDGTPVYYVALTWVDGALTRISQD